MKLNELEMSALALQDVRAWRLGGCAICA